MIIMRSVRKKRGAKLGQHFLTGLWAAKRLAQAVDVRADETILEIGPGKGALTRELLATGARVVAIEKDEVLVTELQRLFSSEIGAGKLRVVLEDIRNVTVETLGLKKYVVAANIPYYITGEIIRQFLTADIQPRAMALLVQKEVAERIVARNHKESILSLSVKVYGSPKIVAKVSKGNFSPPPSIDSAILLVEDISKRSFSDIDESTFFKLVKAGFASKRKFLVNNLLRQFEKENVLRACAQCALLTNVRAEDMGLSVWKKLAQQLS
jgi:16S rRNA (adenine1518-N6/adenine1519-N6)-dimethyltransferase